MRQTGQFLKSFTGPLKIFLTPPKVKIQYEILNFLRPVKEHRLLGPTR